MTSQFLSIFHDSSEKFIFPEFSMIFHHCGKNPELRLYRRIIGLVGYYEWVSSRPTPKHASNCLPQVFTTFPVVKGNFSLQILQNIAKKLLELNSDLKVIAKMSKAIVIQHFMLSCSNAKQVCNAMQNREKLQHVGQAVS